jgi:tetratricopeptide (TPR) repeat protein
VEKRCLMTSLQAVAPIIKSTLMALFGLLEQSDVVAIVDQVMREVRPPPAQMEDREHYISLCVKLCLRTALKLLKAVKLEANRNLFQKWTYLDAKLSKAVVHECLGEISEAKDELLSLVNCLSEELAVPLSASSTATSSLELRIRTLASHALVRLAVLEVESYPNGRTMPAMWSAVVLPPSIFSDSDLSVPGRFQHCVPQRIRAALHFLVALAVLSDQRASASDHIFIINKSTSLSSLASTSVLIGEAQTVVPYNASILSTVAAVLRTGRGILSGADLPGAQGHYNPRDMTTACSYLEPDLHGLVALLPILDSDPYLLVHNPVQTSIAVLYRSLMTSPVLSKVGLQTTSSCWSSASAIADLECALCEDMYIDEDALWDLALVYEEKGQFADALRMFQRCSKQCLQSSQRYDKSNRGSSIRNVRHMQVLLHWLGRDELPSWSGHAYLPLARACSLCINSIPNQLSLALEIAAAAAEGAMVGAHPVSLKGALQDAVGSSLFEYRITTSIPLSDIDELTSEKFSELSWYPLCGEQFPLFTGSDKDITKGLATLVTMLAQIHRAIAVEGGQHGQQLDALYRSQFESHQHLVIAARLYSLLVLEPTSLAQKVTDDSTFFVSSTTSVKWTCRRSYPEDVVLQMAVTLAELGEVTAATALVKDGLGDAEKFPKNRRLMHLLSLLLSSALDSPKVLSSALALTVAANRNQENINIYATQLILLESAGDKIGSRKALNALLAVSSGLLQSLFSMKLSAPATMPLRLCLAELLAWTSLHLIAARRLAEALESLQSGWNILQLPYAPIASFDSGEAGTLSRSASSLRHRPETTVIAVSDAFAEQFGFVQRKIPALKGWKITNQIVSGATPSASSFGSRRGSSHVQASLLTALGQLLLENAKIATDPLSQFNGSVHEGSAAEHAADDALVESRLRCDTYVVVSLYQLALLRCPSHVDALLALANAEMQLGMENGSKLNVQPCSLDGHDANLGDFGYDYGDLLGSGNENSCMNFSRTDTAMDKLAIPAFNVNEERTILDKRIQHFRNAEDLLRRVIGTRELEPRAWALYSKLLVAQGAAVDQRRVCNASIRALECMQFGNKRPFSVVLDDQLLES